MKRFLLAAALAAASLLAVEIGLRAVRLTDFPLYDADNRIGYIPKPNQSGAFLWTNDWAFNDKSMGTDRPFAPDAAKPDILLVGDSIVLGGNTYRRADLLAVRMEALSGRTVWPVAAGSWSLQNELQYLADRPEVVAGVDAIVLVLNSEDLAPASSWTSEAVHPRSRPRSALAHVTAKYILPRKAEASPAELVVRPRPAAEDFAALVKSIEKPVMVWLYPTRHQLLDPAAYRRDPEPVATTLLAHAPAGRVRILHLRNEADWTAACYRDDIHPTPEGNAIFAAAITRQLDSFDAIRLRARGRFL